jgi:hypothetical protein
MTRHGLAAAAIVVVTATLGEAQQAPPRDLRVPVPAGLSISGVVRAADGNAPLRRAIVTMASAVLPKVLSTRTDADGRYEFSGLPASGSFTMTASKTQYLRLEYGQRRPFEPGRAVAISGRSLTNVDFFLPRAAAIAGAVLDSSGEPVEQMWVIAFRRTFVDGKRRLTAVAPLSVTNDIGEYRIAGLAPGDYYIVARERAAAMSEGSRERTGYAVSFFPGTTSVQQAQPALLAVGQQLTGHNLVVSPSRTTTITGHVVRVDGTPVPKGRVSLADHAGSGPGGNMTGGTTSDEQGRFRISGVRGGEYYLMAGGGQERGAIPIDVSGADITGLTLLVGNGGLLSARVVSATGEPLAIQPGHVELSAQLLADPYIHSGVMRPGIKPDWTVDWVGVTGPRVIRATRLPPGWWMKAVVRGDRDITDDAIELTHGQIVKDLTVVLDNRPTEIAGVARDSKGAVAGDCTVIAFSPDARHWTPETRFVRAVRPDHSGRFNVVALPSGVYLIAAVDYVEQGRWLDPEYLESLRSRARKVTLEPAQPVVLELTLIGEGR